MIAGLHIEPAEYPDASLCRDAIQKGLGRAVLWAKNGRWKDQGILLEACINDLRYDRQCEEPRGTWLWGIMEDVGMVDSFRGAILEASLVIADGLSAQQLCQFCVLYARRGDERFRKRLHDVVTHKPVPDCPWLGDAELVELDRETGLLFAARVRGNALQSRDWDWDDAALIDVAKERLGEMTVVTLLDRASATSTEVDRFRKAWLVATAKKPDERGQSLADRMRQLSLDDIIREAESTRNRAGLFRGWGMYAGEDDLRVVLDHLLRSQETDVLVNYLRVFSNRPMPRFDERVLGLLDHGDEHVRGRAFTALAQNTHPAIRKFAIDNVPQRIAETNFLELFVRNFQCGDEVLLLAYLNLPEDPDQCHGFVMDLIKILEGNPSASCRELALRAYRTTPCGACRFDAVKLLVTRQVVPSWLVEECRWDSVPDTRELATKSSSAS